MEDEKQFKDKLFELRLKEKELQMSERKTETSTCLNAIRKDINKLKVIRKKEIINELNERKGR